MGEAGWEGGKDKRENPRESEPKATENSRTVVIVNKISGLNPSIFCCVHQRYMEKIYWARASHFNAKCLDRLLS
jgi:hypothetical protein